MTKKYCHFEGSGLRIRRKGFTSTLKWVLTRRYEFTNALAEKAINAFRRNKFFLRGSNGLTIRVDPDRSQRCCWLEVTTSNETLLDVMKY